MKPLLPITLLLALLATPLHAGWSLVNEASLLTFVTIKKGTTAEVGHFKQLAGSVSDHGQVKLEIDLSSVDTNIEIRDQRMKALLFQVARYPTAVLQARVDSARLATLKPGEATAAKLALELDLHGYKKTLETVVHVTALTGERLLVHSISPVIVNAADFGLAEGIEKLREIAKLPAIATAVPVWVSLVFRKE
jgi:polyisoprenoid-binding protein YceI